MALEYIGEGGISDIRERIFKRRGQATLDGGGMATISFVPPIQLPRQPYIQVTPRIAANAETVICNVVEGTFTTDAQGSYTGVTIKGGRIRGNMPTITPLGVFTLVGSLVTALNNIFASLSGLAIVNSGSVNGVKVDWLAS